MDIEKINDYCTKCKHRDDCKTPCRPVALMLKGEDSAVMEKHTKDFILNYPPNGRLVRFCDYDNEYQKSDDFEYPDYEDEAVKEFKAVPTERNQSSVFFKRFFQRKTFKEITQELGLNNENTAITHFRDAKKHIEKLLAMMERKRFAMESYTTLENRLSKEQVWFLMVRAWGLTAEEVVEIWPQKYTKGYIWDMVNQVGRGEFVSALMRQEKTMEALGEQKNRLPKERVWFVMTQVWGLTIPEVQAIWPKHYSKNYISRLIGETKKAAQS